MITEIKNDADLDAAIAAMNRMLVAGKADTPEWDRLFRLVWEYENPGRTWWEFQQ